jgi:hypothetical protein
MPLPNGLYKVTFQTPQTTEYGVAYLLDGRLRGGDSGMAYVGSYTQDGDVFSADVSVTQHRHVPGVVSALGYNDIRIQLEGVAGDSTVELRGASADTPGVRFSARLGMIAD